MDGPMNGYRGMAPAGPNGPGGPNGMYQPQQAAMEPGQRAMMGSSAHMAGGQVVANNMMNGSPMPMGPAGAPAAMNGMMGMMPQQAMGPNGPQPGHMMGQQGMAPQGPAPHMGAPMDANGMGMSGAMPGGGAGGGGGGGGVRACAGCGGKILERFLFHALDRFWHHGCLKCSCCGARLADIGVSCYTKAGMILCRPDYVR